jgi:AcrR family transcriptional regulator
MAKIKSTDNSFSKRDVIVNVAAGLFKEKGYKASSMRELATRVGVEAASLYNHIKSKDELLRDICFAVLKKFHAHIEKLENEKLPGAEKVEKIVRFHVNEMMVNYDHVYVTDQNWRQLDEPGLTQYRELRRQYRRRFTAIVQKGIDDNEIKQMDANSIVMVILNAIAAVDQWHRIIHKVSSGDLENIIVSILVDGIIKTPT